MSNALGAPPNSTFRIADEESGLVTGGSDLCLVARVETLVGHALEELGLPAWGLWPDSSSWSHTIPTYTGLTRA